MGTGWTRKQLRDRSICRQLGDRNAPAAEEFTVRWYTSDVPWAPRHSLVTFSRHFRVKDGDFVMAYCPVHELHSDGRKRLVGRQGFLARFVLGKNGEPMLENYERRKIEPIPEEQLNWPMYRVVRVDFRAQDDYAARQR